MKPYPMKSDHRAGTKFRPTTSRGWNKEARRKEVTPPPPPRSPPAPRSIVDRILNGEEA